MKPKLVQLHLNIMCFQILRKNCPFTRLEMQE